MARKNIAKSPDRRARGTKIAEILVKFCFCNSRCVNNTRAWKIFEIIHGLLDARGKKSTFSSKNLRYLKYWSEIEKKRPEQSNNTYAGKLVTYLWSTRERDRSRSWRGTEWKKIACSILTLQVESEEKKSLKI